MTIRTIALLAAFSAALLGSTASFAAQEPAGFQAQLSDAREALTTRSSAAIGREERNEADKYLDMAESLWNRGSTAKARQFLSFGRGMLGLSTPADVTAAERVGEHVISVH